MRVAEVKVYKFDELSEDIQEKVIENYYDINTDGDYWYEHIFDDAKELGKVLGIEIENIYFSGFSSQGDGAQFVGSYSYNKGALKNLKSYAPNETELHAIAKELQDLQRRNFYSLSASVKPRGHYSHSGCTEIDVIDERTSGYSEPECSEDLRELLRDFMDWIYKSLETEYDYQTKKEQIIETLKINDYEFTEDGKIY